MLKPLKIGGALIFATAGSVYLDSNEINTFELQIHTHVYVTLGDPERHFSLGSREGIEINNRYPILWTCDLQLSPPQGFDILSSLDVPPSFVQAYLTEPTTMP